MCSFGWFCLILQISVHMAPSPRDLRPPNLLTVPCSLFGTSPVCYWVNTAVCNCLITYLLTVFFYRSPSKECKFHGERILTILFITVSPTAAILPHTKQVPIYMKVCRKDKPHRWRRCRGHSEKEFLEEDIWCEHWSSLAMQWPCLVLLAITILLKMNGIDYYSASALPVFKLLRTVWNTLWYTLKPLYLTWKWLSNPTQSHC